MVDISDVLAEKYLGMEWGLNGDPTNQAEFTKGFILYKSNGLETPTWAELQTELVKMRAAALWDDLRTQRDLLLHETDWWASSDLPAMTDAQTQYRQALRDLPATTDDATSPTWPTKPE